MKRIILVIALTTFYLSVFAQKAGVSKVNADDLTKTVKYLSSKRFMGRLPGTPYYEHAARYVATRFKNSGLKPLDGNNMLQEFNDEVNIILDAQVYILDENNRPIYPMRLGKDFICRGFSGAGEIRGEVVFAGFGIKTDEYNDYRSISVKDKIVAVFKSAPPWKPSSGNWGDWSPRAKARIAQELGAKGIIFIGEPNGMPKTMIYGSIACGSKPHLNKFPMIQAGERLTDSLFSKLPYSPKEYYEMLKRDKAPHSIETGKSVYMRVVADYQEFRKTYNVVGYIEGSDPKLKNEYIILGAHLDHVGYQGNHVYFPGANDNASGVASIIAIAEALKESPKKPRRSIVFVAFSSEESGLKGSTYFVNHLPFSTDNVIAMLNFDCIGSGDSIAIGGGETYKRLWRKAMRLDKRNTRLLTKKTFGGGGADAQPFHEKGIPTLYFYAKNGYQHLHQATDTQETLNPLVFEKTVRLGFLTTEYLAKGRYRKERAK
jgi:hypothetical protein